jgi:hypothetical protein
MIDLRVAPLAREMGSLAVVTRQHAWADDDQNCKIIPTSEYVKALTVAIILAKENPRLDMPTPGADPDGFVWLTYVDGPSRGLALELRPGKYRWTQSNMGDKRTFESDSLDDVAAAMRAVFPQSAILR